MAKSDPNRADPRVDAYLLKHERWRAPLEQVRAVIATTALEETIKWGGPAYTLDGKVVLGLAAYSQHCAIWFHQGVFLADKAGKLRNAQESTRAMRQWRIEQDTTLPKRVLTQYIREAVANERLGKRLAPRPKGALVIAEELRSALSADKALATAFQALTPGRQREYSDHIASAKRPATRKARLEKARVQILDGRGLHDQYRDRRV